MLEVDGHARRYGTGGERRREPLRVDVAVVGAGAAGSTRPSTAAAEGARVALVSRSPLAQTASYWAQGGIAAALADDDSPELHAEDTLTAGRAAARASAVRVLCEESPARVRDLEQLGVSFDADRHGNLALGLEGGHSRRRIVHAGGAATGRRITRELSARAALDERIEILEPRAATSLTTSRAAASGSWLARAAATRCPSWPEPSCSPRAGWRRSGSAARTRAERWARACCSRTRPAPSWPTSSSCSSTRPRCATTGRATAS